MESVDIMWTLTVNGRLQPGYFSSGAAAWNHCWSGVFVNPMNISIEKVQVRITPVGKKV